MGQPSAISSLPGEGTWDLVGFQRPEWHLALLLSGPAPMAGDEMTKEGCLEKIQALHWPCVRFCTCQVELSGSLLLQSQSMIASDRYVDMRQVFPACLLIQGIDLCFNATETSECSVAPKNMSKLSQQIVVLSLFHSWGPTNQLTAIQNAAVRLLPLCHRQQIQESPRQQIHSRKQSRQSSTVQK